MAIDDLPETHVPVEPEKPTLVEVQAPVEKRKVGRPAEGVKGFATRLSPETIHDIKTLADGLRLRSEGKAIEKAVAFYKAHLLREVRATVGDFGDEGELLKNAHKID